MDSMDTQLFVEMGVSLTELTIKDTTTEAANRIRTEKDEKNAEKLQNIYYRIVVDRVSSSIVKNLSCFLLNSAMDGMLINFSFTSRKL